MRPPAPSFSQNQLGSPTCDYRPSVIVPHQLYNKQLGPTRLGHVISVRDQVCASIDFKNSVVADTRIVSITRNDRGSSAVHHVDTAGIQEWPDHPRRST